MTEWQVKKVGDIADTQLGKMLNKGKQSGKHAKPYLRTDNVHWGRFDLSEIKEMDILPEEQDKYLATKGDLLMCEGGASGRTAIWNEDYDISFQNHVHRIRPKDLKEISPKYLLYYFEWFIKNGFASDLIKGVTISSLSQSGLRSIEVTYPPIDEQHKIVELLEDHLSRLDAALVDIKQAKLKAAQFRRSLLLSLMSPDYAGSSGDWTRTTLGNVCDLVAGKTPPSLESSIVGIDNSSRTVPFYKVGDMNLHPEYLCESRLYLSAKQVEDRKLFILPEGSVVFPKAGGAIATNKKRIILVPGPIDLNCMAAIPIHGTNPKYLSWWFQSINLSTFADGSILPQLSKGKMSEIIVDWPNLKLQEEIVLILEKSLSKNSEGIKLAEAVEANSSSLRRSLLQAAFTGQLTKEVVSV
jgi:type I restriction enzyme S subunit